MNKVKKMEKNMARNIGVEVNIPKETCNDKKCAFHGKVKVRGKTFTGKIVSTDFNRTATVEWKRHHYIAKYERYELRRSKVKAHNPSCISAKVGDTVKIIECRPLSKTKNFIIIEKLETKK